jgi:hypothetical protein
MPPIPNSILANQLILNDESLPKIEEEEYRRKRRWITPEGRGYPQGQELNACKIGIIPLRQGSKPSVIASYEPREQGERERERERGRRHRYAEKGASRQTLTFELEECYANYVIS